MVASCDVLVELILVVTCDVRACIFRLAKCNHNIAHFFGNNERTDNLLAFGVSYIFVVQKWMVLAIFHKRNEFLGNYLEGIGI